MSKISRRSFLKRSLAAGIAGGIVLSGGMKLASAGVKSQGTMIDLTKCDGCKNATLPSCVSACREKNKPNFPEPVENIHDYWPQKKHEDWSKKRDLTDQLTPYNWTFVQHMQIEHQGSKEDIYIPRRCMHCDNPPCAKLCPFGAQEKTPEGAVVIDPKGCFGGAKCRDVCPWHIPQRQAGVGIYLSMMPQYVGGGVMYKCDLCIDNVRQGQNPACVEACPQKAISFGDKEAMRELAHKRVKEIGGYIYGEKENGGTSTFYVSRVSFEQITKQLKEKELKPGMPVSVENYLESANGLAKSFAIAPVAGIFAAGIAAYRSMKGEE